MTKQNNSKDRFILNEPPVKIKNGASRKSSRVLAKDFPVRIQRDRINSLLLMHDIEPVPGLRVTEKDLSLLKQIVTEGAISNNIPALRYNAILKLASFPSPKTLNMISYLANHGEDYYIRSHAVLALGETGIDLAIPHVLEAMSSKNILIQNAARKALIKLANTVGTDQVKQYHFTGNKFGRKMIEKILESPSKTRAKINSKTKGEMEK